MSRLFGAVRRRRESSAIHFCQSVPESDGAAIGSSRRPFTGCAAYRRWQPGAARGTTAAGRSRWPPWTVRRLRPIGRRRRSPPAQRSSETSRRVSMMHTASLTTRAYLRDTFSGGGDCNTTVRHCGAFRPIQLDVGPILSPSSIIWYRPMGGGALRLGR